MKHIQYVDPFHGNGTIDLPEPEGIAAAWHFIKGLCGNTHPGAVLPFGKYSVCPYTGGYSSGYGINQVNSGEPIRKLMEEMRIIGFSHFHHSGTGAIGVYYNYAVVTPYAGEKLDRYTPAGETAAPGYYAVTLAESGIHCECTVAETGAYHRYTFPAGGGSISVDFENDGLYTDSLRGKAVDPVVKRISDSELRASVTLQNVRFHFAVVFRGNGALDGDGIYHMSEAGQVTVILTAGCTSMEDTLRESAGNTMDFDRVRSAAAETWEQSLGRIDVDSDEDENELRIFYSNLYQSLIKPCDWGGGGFLWEGAPFVVDFATMWDIYKTNLPLIYTLYPAVSEHIAAMYLRLGKTLGKLPHCFI
ncbi:MAG: glycoside hydrolase family 92 protein, partial [Clostridia bacterium]|nr:glycoside hydrolase family 92 protein [Clostridia bacterium]